MALYSVHKAPPPIPSWLTALWIVLVCAVTAVNQHLQMVGLRAARRSAKDAVLLEAELTLREWEWAQALLKTDGPLSQAEADRAIAAVRSAMANMTYAIESRVDPKVRTALRGATENAVRSIKRRVDLNSN